MQSIITGVALIFLLNSCATNVDMDSCSTQREPLPVYDTSELKSLSELLDSGVALLRTRDSRFGEKTCVASLLTPSLAITAYHCVVGENDRVLDSLVLVPIAEVRESSRGIVVKPVWTSSSVALDYILLELSEPADYEFTPIALAFRVPQISEPIVLLDFDENGVARHQSCVILDKPDNVEPSYIAHSCNTIDGSSGGPLISRVDGATVGLHVNNGRIARFGNYSKDILAVERLLDPMRNRQGNDSRVLDAADNRVSSHFFTVVSLTEDNMLADRYVHQSEYGLVSNKCISQLKSLRTLWEERIFIPRPATP